MAGQWRARIGRIDRVVGRHGCVAVVIAEPYQVAVAEHDVVGAGPAPHGLMKIVAHGIVVGECLEVRHVALLDVVEAHRGRAFASRRIGEARRLRLAVLTDADRHFHPGKQIGKATPAISSGLRGGIAIELLEHLIEAVHRARRVGVIGECFRRDLERTGRKMARALAVVEDAFVGRFICLAGPAGQKKLIIVAGQTIFELHGERQNDRTEARGAASEPDKFAHVRS